MHTCRIEIEEERFVGGFRLVDEFERKVENFVINGLHPLGIERTRILDLLLAYLAPARVHCGVILIGRPGMDHVARPDYI